jgi:hypothetical protein
MKSVSLRASAPGSADDVFARITDATALLGGYTATRDDDETLLVEHTETPWWLAGLFAPAFKRRNTITATVRDGQVRALGHGSGAMIGFLEAYLLQEDRPALSARLRELAAREGDPR